MKYTKAEIQRSIDNVKRKITTYRELYLETVIDNVRADCAKQVELLTQRIESLEQMLKETK